MTTYPMHAVTLPAALRGRTNGQLADSILVSTPGQSSGPVVRLVAPAARAWRALCAAALAAGHTLTATSLYDSYRPYAVQESTFRARYTTTRIAGAATKMWQGETWYQRPGTAVAAVPGTSNHGLGLAVDVANVDSALSWLLVNVGRFGWSWELTSEPWHLHYYAGDAIPAAVLAYEEGTMADTALTDCLTILTGLSHGVEQVSVHDRDGVLSLTPLYARIAAEVAGRSPAVAVDAAQLAAALGPAVKAALSDPATVSAIATAVLDEQHRRDAA
jgi:LAS superfamily LD-carboxypeptidase LdcB